MKFRFLALIFSFMILLGSMAYLFGKPFVKLKRKKTDIGNAKEVRQRSLEEKDEYDSYIILYFKENCIYSEVFKNDYRNDISFIFQRQNNTKFQRNETLNISKEFGIEIHFEKAVNSMENFFSRTYDQNMAYLISIDFSNFDSSLVNKTSSMFSGCRSLETIDFNNFNTSLVTNMA